MASQESPSIDTSSEFRRLVELHGSLQSYGNPDEIDHAGELASLGEQIDQWIKVPHGQLAQLIRLLSRNVVLLLGHIPTKAYDFANEMLNHLEAGGAAPRVAAVILTDLFDTFPNQLNSLVSYLVGLIYKIIKKNPAHSDVAWLLGTITKNAVKNDIDDKLSAKLAKIVTKQVLGEGCVILKRNYLVVLKNILVLSIHSNYEHLLEMSVSTSSAGSKMKPDHIMAQQHQFQHQLLVSNDKVLRYGLSSQCREVRVAAIDLLAHLLINFVATGKLDPVEYLVLTFVFPDQNSWDESLSARVTADGVAIDIRTEKNLLQNHDSESIIHRTTEQRIYNSSVISSLLLFIQLQQFQYPDFIVSNLSHYLDLVLAQFEVSETHFQDLHWNAAYTQWTILVDHLVREAGVLAHEILAEYVFNRFTSEQAVTTAVTTDKKRELRFFKSKTTSKAVRLAKIDPYNNAYQAALLLHIVEYLLPYGTTFQLVKSNEGEDTPAEDNFISNLLLRLLVNRNASIRNHALQTLLRYTRTIVEINPIILTVFRLVNEEYDSLEHDHDTSNSSSPYGQVRLLSYSLALSSLIKQTEVTSIQNSTILLILSFCTQGLKHAANSVKGLASWIILSSLVTFYNDSEIVKLNLSQLLVFWKSLLTSQYVSTGDDNKTQIIDNLKLRNFSLVCLLNYLDSVEVSPESLKQIQFLLTKSYNYLTYLENSVGLHVTSFGTDFNEYDFNANMTNNIAYSNYVANKKLSFDRVLASLVFYGKKVILQSLTKLTALLKSDINSHMVIFLLKVFGDAKTFLRLAGDSKDKKKQTLFRLKDFDESLILLGEDYNHFFGVTSKFGEHFGKEVFDELEALNHRLVDRHLNYDVAVYLVDSHLAPPLYTSLVDLSIELFEGVFPYLSHKIKFSLLEQLRNSLTATGIDPLRYQALCVNITVALSGVLANHKGSLDKELAEVVLDILGKIDTSNQQLVSLISESIGRTLALAPQLSETTTAQYIGAIVADTDPAKRGSHVLTLGAIYGHTHAGYNDIYNVVRQLLKDPNPAVYHYSLEAAARLVEANLTNHTLVGELVDVIHENYLDDAFAYQNDRLVDLNVRYNTIGPTTRVLQLAVTALGPGLREWLAESRQKLADLIVGLAAGVGLSTLLDYSLTYKHLLQLLQELMIYDPSVVPGNVKFFTELLDLIIAKNIKIGLVVPPQTSLNKEALFPFNTSVELYELAYDCYGELLKVHGVEVLTKDTVRLLWISMNLRRCEPLKNLINLWLELSLTSNWFAQLNSLFKLSEKKLVGPFIEKNYQQKLLPLSQRQKKKTAAVEIKDEEVENIVGSDDDASQDKNEPITWEFKHFIYELLNKLLAHAARNSSLVDQLRGRIQDIVKVLFLGTTSPLLTIKLLGTDLLDKALGLFGHLADPLYPGVSILEQQQAQIISALIPCFSPSSDSRVIVKAINVASKFINLPRIKFYSKQRILKTLIYLLEELSSNKYLKFGFLEHMSEFNKKLIQLSILNCWALLKIESNGPDAEPELAETLDKYATLLTSLWIVVLRELASLKYNEATNNDRELALYSNYWVNFVGVLSLELEKNDSVREYLDDDETNFLFILFSQCVESLIKNQNVSEVLVTLERLAHNAGLVEILFHDDIFGEVIDLFDRLVLIDEDTEHRVRVLVIVSTIFHTFVGEHPDFTEFDKLFELVRVTMAPLFTILPFLRNDSSEAPKNYDSAPNLLVLKLVFSHLVSMTSAFPEVVKDDLHSCVLYVFARLYEFDNPLLKALLLPHLKQVVGGNRELVVRFYSLIHQYLDNSENSVYTLVILITHGDIRPDKPHSVMLADTLVSMLSTSSATAIQCIKSLLQYSATHDDVYAVKYLVAQIARDVARGESSKLGLEVLVLFAKSLEEDRAIHAYVLVVRLLLEGSDDYARSKILGLIQHNPAVFKGALAQLSEAQRTQTEELVKRQADAGVASESEPDIQLKRFG